MQADGEAPHDMRGAISCEQGHTFCIECLGIHSMQCTRCGGLACCYCPGHGEANCPECTYFGRIPLSLCAPCFEICRFRCCKRAALTKARCHFHHWTASICACGTDLCSTCMRLGRCPCGEFLPIHKQLAPVPPAPRPSPYALRVLSEPERSAFQSPRYRPAPPPAAHATPVTRNN